MATLTVYASIDSTMKEQDPDTAFGGSISITHGVMYLAGVKLEWNRGIGNFDVSALEGETINSAKLVREITQINGAPGFNAKLSRCTRWDTWTEMATWNDYAWTLPWTTGGGDYDDTGPPAAIVYAEAVATGEHEIAGLKPFVEDALDNRDGIVSLITRLDAEAPEVSRRITWRSKNYGSDIWRLVIDYGEVIADRRRVGSTVT